MWIYARMIPGSTFASTIFTISARGGEKAVAGAGGVVDVWLAAGSAGVTELIALAVAKAHKSTAAVRNRPPD